MYLVKLLSSDITYYPLDTSLSETMWTIKVRFYTPQLVRRVPYLKFGQSSGLSYSKTNTSSSRQMHKRRREKQSTASSLVVAIDSGTTLILVPTNVAKAFYRNIPGSIGVSFNGSTIWEFPCNTSLGETSFSFGSTKYSINHADLVLPYELYVARPAE